LTRLRSAGVRVGEPVAFGSAAGDEAGGDGCRGRSTPRSSGAARFEIYVRDNVVATQRLYEAPLAPETRVVFASSSSVYGNAEAYPTREDADTRPVSPYGVTKLACEHLAGAYRSSFGRNVVSLRYFTVYGPRQRPDMAFARISQALACGTPFHVYGNGEQTRQFTFVQDAVRATLAAMERAPGGSVYNVGGGTEASLRDVIALGEQLTGRRLDVRYTDAGAGDVRRTAADISRIRSELGWEPCTSLEAALTAQLL
jgi:UDP-glucuronate 4-epimerase